MKLKSCEVCGAITHKDDAKFHAEWHAEEFAFRAWVERELARIPSPTGEQA